MDKSHFKPAWWLHNSHLQTIWPALCNKLRGIDETNTDLKRERIELPDGDFIDLDWMGKERLGPTVLILHGFEGSIHSHYAKGMLKSIYKMGWRGVFMHFRGCSGVPNRLPRGYHSGETNDVAYIIDRILDREPNTTIAVVGYSLGGNVLLKWLGECGSSNPLSAAVAISVPYQLDRVAFRVQRGFSRFYQWYLLKCARQRLLSKPHYIPPIINLDSLARAYTVTDFDSHYTVPLHGFSSVEEYYSKTSCRQYLKSITVPTLLLHAKDDPFMTEDAIPHLHELSPSVLLEVTDSGGHVGFVSGAYPWAPRYWLEDRVPEFLKHHW